MFSFCCSFDFGELIVRNQIVCHLFHCVNAACLWGLHFCLRAAISLHYGCGFIFALYCHCLLIRHCCLCFLYLICQSQTTRCYCDNFEVLFIILVATDNQVCAAFVQLIEVRPSFLEVGFLFGLVMLFLSWLIMVFVLFSFLNTASQIG